MYRPASASYNANCARIDKIQLIDGLSTKIHEGGGPEFKTHRSAKTSRPSPKKDTSVDFISLTLISVRRFEVLECSNPYLGLSNERSGEGNVDRFAFVKCKHGIVRHLRFLLPNINYSLRVQSGLQDLQRI